MSGLCRPGSSVDIATDYGLDGPGLNPGGDEIFRTCPDRPWGPSSLLYNGYRVFPGGKVRPERAADHSLPSSVAVMEEYSYNSTHPLGHTGPVTGSLYLYLNDIRSIVRNSSVGSHLLVPQYVNLTFMTWFDRFQYKVIPVFIVQFHPYFLAYVKVQFSTHSYRVSLCIALLPILGMLT